MANAGEPVNWLADGTPRSARFDDYYRRATGGLAQAREVFLKGCGLPQAWAGQPQWRILETGFGLGLNFLATWQAWKDDPRRPRILHFVSVEAWPVATEDLMRSASAWPELGPLASELASQWFGLVPGVHRLAFEDGRVLLTLCIGDVQTMLRTQTFKADSVFLDGFVPQRNARMWELHTLKAVVRLCRRGTTTASWTAVGQVRRDLAQCGFRVEEAEGLPPKRHSLRGVFDPAWELRGRVAAPAVDPGTCIVIGGGLAGAAAAASLARRGWQVTVVDAASAPAAGASGVPAGLLAPNFSPDDNLLSRLSRAGVRLALQQAQALLHEGEDWQANGVLARLAAADSGVVAGLCAQSAAWSRPAGPQQRAQAQLDDATPARWHERAGWIKPSALVRAWLGQPGISWRGSARVTRLEWLAQGWQVHDAGGHRWEPVPLVVLAAGYESALLLQQPPPLHPIRGQVSWAPRKPDAFLPPFAVNGNGHFIPHVTLEGEASWVCGSSFGRGETDLAPREAEHQANLERLQALLPAVAAQLAPEFANGEVRAWTGIRCASIDRRPLVGCLADGLWLSTAMGSRGLTFAALAAELLAAQLHGEPLPLEARLATALAPGRHSGWMPDRSPA